MLQAKTAARTAGNILARYALGAGLFLLAFGLTSASSAFRSHYPYLAYFAASLGAGYLAGFGPANLTAALSAAAVYATYAPAGFLVTPTQTPASAATAVLVLLLGCNWLVGSLKTSRDRLKEERERYARLAENRDLLYRELQHRVSNNIQIISGLLLLQRQSVEDPAARRALTEAAGRIGLIARIQRQLQAAPDQPAPFHRFAQELLSDAIAASGAPGVRLEVEGGEHVLPPEQATAVSLVMLECVNNALEHAFADGRGGVVRVALVEEGADQLLTVADDGRGLPPDFDLDGGRSLGLRIVRTMAEQLGGTFVIAPGAPGAVCRLRFPASPQAA